MLSIIIFTNWHDFYSAVTTTAMYWNSLYSLHTRGRLLRYILEVKRAPNRGASSSRARYGLETVVCQCFADESRNTTGAGDNTTNSPIIRSSLLWHSTWIEHNLLVCPQNFKTLNIVKFVKCFRQKKLYCRLTRRRFVPHPGTEPINSLFWFGPFILK